MEKNKKMAKSRRINKNAGLAKKYKRILIVLIDLIILMIVFNLANNYVKTTDDLKVLVNSNNVSYINEPYYDNGVLYMSIEDVDNLFGASSYAEKNNIDENTVITIYGSKITRITEGSTLIEVNDTTQTVSASLQIKDNIYYIPVSELGISYNLEVEKFSENIVSVELLNCEEKIAYLSESTKIRYKETNLSRNLQTIKKGEKVTLISEGEKWSKIRSNSGNVGYVKTKYLKNITVEREAMELSQTIIATDEEAVSELSDNDLDNYKIDEITESYDSRKEFIQKIVNTAVNNQLKGIRINITNVENAENYYKFLNELKIYLHDYGMSLIVVKTDNLDSSKLEEIVDEVV